MVAVVEVLPVEGAIVFTPSGTTVHTVAKATSVQHKIISKFSGSAVESCGGPSYGECLRKRCRF
jgi:hypothetical protein